MEWNTRIHWKETRLHV